MKDHGVYELVRNKNQIRTQHQNKKIEDPFSRCERIMSFQDQKIVKMRERDRDREFKQELKKQEDSDILRPT